MARAPVVVDGAPDARAMRGWHVSPPIRSLPSSRAARVRTPGGHASGDAVYDEGTVWTWLLGTFALAHYLVGRGTCAGSSRRPAGRCTALSQHCSLSSHTDETL